MRRVGYIKDKLDIKILILYMLSRMHTSIDFDQVCELVLFDDGIDYFLFAESLAELVETGHLSKSNDGMYSATEKGCSDGQICESSLPLSVRTKAEKQIAALHPIFLRNALIKTGVEEDKTGCCTVSLSLSDGVGQVMQMQVLTGNAAQATAIMRNFRRNAEKIYNAVMNDLSATY